MSTDGDLGPGVSSRKCYRLDERQRTAVLGGCGLVEGACGQTRWHVLAAEERRTSVGPSVLNVIFRTAAVVNHALDLTMVLFPSVSWSMDESIDRRSRRLQMSRG